jgi:glycosidase
MNNPLALPLLLTGLLFLSGSVVAQSMAPDWEGQIIYQVMPDRFSDGDRTNNAGVNLSDPGAWHGGDLTGLTDRLDYIRALGATAVWMTPVYQQVGPVGGVAGYHGYWPEEFRNVDPHFGTLDSFRALTGRAHSLGLKVMLDQVINHYGYGAAATIQNPGWFHTQADCAAADDAHKDTDCPLSGLPDLNQTNPAVAAFLNGNDDFWRAQGVDAFRYDAVKHVDQGYLKSLVTRDRAAGTFTLGEYFGADADRVREYQDLGLGSLFEFSLQDALRRGIMSGQGLSGVRSVLEQDAAAPHPGQIANFLDNHDLPRYANGTLFEDQGQTQTAYALRALMTLRGIPVIWQGTEYAQRGGKDPDNRRDMRFGSALSAGEKAVYDTTRDAIAVRRASAALSTGDQVLLAVPDGASNDLLAFTRAGGGQKVLVAWNNAKARTTYSLRSGMKVRALTPSLFHEPDGSGQKAGMSVSGGYLHLSLPAKSVAVFELGSD